MHYFHGYKLFQRKPQPEEVEVKVDTPKNQNMVKIKIGLDHFNCETEVSTYISKLESFVKNHEEYVRLKDYNIYWFAKARYEHFKDARDFVTNSGPLVNRKLEELRRKEEELDKKHNDLDELKEDFKCGEVYNDFIKKLVKAKLFDNNFIETSNLTRKQCACVLGVTIKDLAKKREFGNGPKWVKEQNVFYYNINDVVNYFLNQELEIYYA